MKYKLIAAVLALTVMSWAQTATQTAPSTPQQSTAPAEKGKCPCCDKLASTDAKESHSCCAQHDMKAGEMGDMKDMGSCCASKDKASCCDSKDAKSCMKGDKDGSAKSCCGDKCSKEKMASCCGDKCSKDGKGCCAGKKTDKNAKNCCADKLES